jgi:hypothetical protein
VRAESVLAHRILVRPLSDFPRIHVPFAKNSCLFGGYKIPRNTVVADQWLQVANNHQNGQKYLCFYA